MNYKSMFLVFCSSILTIGCATTYQAVTIVSNPPNADIYINHIYKGKAPLTERLLTDGFATNDTNKRHQIVAKMNGYDDEIAVLQSTSYFMNNTQPFPDTLKLYLKKSNYYGPRKNPEETKHTEKIYRETPAPTKKLNKKKYDGPKIMIAIIDFNGKDVPPSIAFTISELIRTEIINTGKYIVIERSQMKEILREQGFQQTGCTDTSCAVQIGKLLSAKKILIGSVMKLGSKLIISGRVVDVEKGIGEQGATGRANSVDELDSGVIEFINNLSDL